MSRQDLSAFDQPGKHVVERSLKDEVETSYLEYAYSVIHSRALPDARDGLKPVHRRILHSMNGMSLRSNGPFAKSARVVGICMGQYHPHGDSAIYEAMVRMAQDFALNTPLVDGHGNFGSPDDPPAAARYTESRMSMWAEQMVAELKEDTVDFVPNYDGSLTEPEVLPAPFPNLLVNGSSGIAVGMATNMIPHNFSEVMAAARWVLTHPNASIEKLMEFVPGPDLPTGGLLLGLDEVRKAYTTGRGIIRVRARSHFDDVPGSRGRRQVVFTELPYGVGAEKVIEAIKKEIATKRLQGVADVKDLTDRVNGMRLVVEAKVGVNPEVLLAALYRFTPLETSFGINNLALVGGQPKTLGLVELLNVFVDHRVDVVRRRTQHRRQQMLDRLHLVEGLLIALLDIDKVIAIIRAADNAAAARDKLISTFKLSDIQTQYILDTPLRRLTKYDRLSLEAEADELRAGIAELDTILGDESVLRGLVGKELETLAKANPTPRRTTLVDGDLKEVLAVTIEAPLEVEDSPCEVLLSTSGLLVRAESFTPSQKRVKHDAILGRVQASVRGEVLIVTNHGRAARVPVIGLPVVASASAAGGMPVREMFGLEPGEKPVGIAPVGAGAEAGYGLAIGTRDGVVKVQAPNWPVRGDEFSVIGLKDGDEVVAARWLHTDEAEFAFVTTDAQLLVFDGSAVRAQGALSGGGVAGIKLTAGQRVLGFAALPKDEAADAVVVSSNGGNTKVTPLLEYPRKGRATGGVRCQRFLAGGGQSLVLAFVGVSPRGATSAGAPLSLPAVDRRRDGSGELGAMAPDLIGSAI